MKKVFVMIVCCFVVNGKAGTSILKNKVNLNNTDVVNLSEVNANILAVALPYPGPLISGLCGIELRSDSYGRENSIEKLLDQLVFTSDDSVKPKVSVRNKMTLVIDLTAASGGYLYEFSMMGKYGQTLGEAVSASLGENRKVILMGISCK